MVRRYSVSFLLHISVLKLKLANRFGWSKSYKPSKLVKDEDSPTSSGYNSSQEEEDADYEE